MDLKKIELKKIHEQLRKDISKLGYNEHCEIFNIIRKDNTKVSKNNYGVFINLQRLKTETLVKVQKFVEYCKNNKNLIDNINEPEPANNEPANNSNMVKNNIEKQSNDEDVDSFNNMTFKENLTKEYESYSIEDSHNSVESDNSANVILPQTILTSMTLMSSKKKKRQKNIKNISHLNYDNCQGEDDDDNDDDNIEDENNKHILINCDMNDIEDDEDDDEEECDISLDVSLEEYSSQINENKQIPMLYSNKMKLFGVKERIMKKCKNISKEQQTVDNFFRTSFVVENILDDKFESLSKLSECSQNKDSINDELNDELTEDLP